MNPDVAAANSYTLTSRSFAGDADNASGMPAVRDNSPSQAMGSGLPPSFRDSLHVQSPQPSLDASLSGAPSPAGSASDWLPQQPSPANGEGLAFSSSLQGHNPGYTHRPPLDMQADVTRLYVPPSTYAHKAQGFQLDPQYADAKSVAAFSGFSFSESLPSQGSQQLLVANDSSRALATQPYTSPGHTRSFSYSQPNPAVLSRQSSDDGTLTAGVAHTEGMEGLVSSLSMLNSSNHSLGLPGPSHSYFQNDGTNAQAESSYIGAIGSAAFSLPHELQPVGEPCKTHHTWSDTGSSITTPRSVADQGKHSGVPGTSDRRRRSDPCPVPPGNPEPQPRARLPRPRAPRRHATIRPRPPQSNAGTVVDRSRIRISLPKKSRGKRTKPLEHAKRQLATKRRNERTVCIGCKMAKVMVSRRRVHMHMTSHRD